MKVRINKFLSQAGVCSRREADVLVAKGKVLINGRKAVLGDAAGPEDTVIADGKPITAAVEHVVFAFHKPVGAITSNDPEKRDTIYELLPKDLPRVFPVGRLDVESSGLLLLTNDGELANRLMHPRYEHEKEYVVTVDKNMPAENLTRMREGIVLDGSPTLPAKITRMGPRLFSIVLREGRNRQIRRMCEAVGLTVLRLQRVRVANIRLGDLKPGGLRTLNATEVRTIKELAGLAAAERRQGRARRPPRE
jgi:pseudouridine synthase